MPGLANKLDCEVGSPHLQTLWPSGKSAGGWEGNAMGEGRCISRLG